MSHKVKANTGKKGEFAFLSAIDGTLGYVVGARVPERELVDMLRESVFNGRPTQVPRGLYYHTGTHWISVFHHYRDVEIPVGVLKRIAGEAACDDLKGVVREAKHVSKELMKEPPTWMAGGHG